MAFREISLMLWKKMPWANFHRTLLSFWCTPQCYTFSLLPCNCALHIKEMMLKVRFEPFKHLTIQKGFFTDLFKCISAHANEVHSLFRTFLNHAFETCLEIAICTLLGNSVVVVLVVVAKKGIANPNINVCSQISKSNCNTSFTAFSKFLTFQRWWEKK